MLVRIDPAKDEPVFSQLAASVRRDIISGSMAAGDRLPAAKELATALSINVHTVLHAYQVLRDEGLVELRRGRGATVTGAAEGLTTLREDVTHLVEAASRVGVGREALAGLVRDIPA